MIWICALQKDRHFITTFYSVNSATKIWNFGKPLRITKTIPNRKKWQQKLNRFTRIFWPLINRPKNNKFVSINSLKKFIFKNWYELFILIQVNVDAETRSITLANIQCDNPDEHAFDRAQRRIQHMMERDSYQRFLKSDVFLELVNGTKNWKKFLSLSSSLPWIIYISYHNFVMYHNIVSYIDHERIRWNRSN